MPALRSTYVRGFSHRLGRIESVAELAVPEVERARLERLGMVSFARSVEASLVGLMQEAAAESLLLAALDASAIDRILLTTSDFLQEKNRDDVAEVACALGIEHAVPLGISQGFCTNFSLAFEVADCLIATERARAILLLTADRYRSDAVRVLRGNAGVGSDGVAACVITSEPGGGYLLKSVAHAYAPLAMELRAPDRLVEYVEVYAAGYASACRRALAEAEIQSGACARLVVPNFSRSVLRNLSELSGIPHARVYDDNVARFGHCNSADQLSALGELETELTPGSAVLVTGAGEYVWGAAVMIRVED